MTSPTPGPSTPGPTTPSSRAPSSGETAAGGGGSFWRFLMGWVVVPLFVAGSIFGAGVHCGARHTDAWYTKAAVWVQQKVVPSSKATVRTP